MIFAIKVQMWAAVFCLVVLLATESHACPDHNGLLDRNCDGRVILVTFGDSITQGVRDEEGLGYPGRIELKLPDVQVHNLGLAGEKTPNGKNRALSSFPNYADADFIVILEGVNDYFIEPRSSERTKNNLFSILFAAENVGAIPVLAQLTAVRRDFQRPWVSGVNSKISSRTRVDFFSLGESIISSDLLHPNGEGYEEMADLLIARLQEISNEERPADSDSDGIYDFAETQFGANAALPDTDGDGITDGQEVFVYGSSPISLDSDEDGLSDSLEVNTLGSNPADPRPGAPTMQSLEAITN